ncbi:MAG: hydantoinase B/oxoprolinase family protein, partial [Comamonas sp.]
MKRIALLTTEGFADMLELGRQNRPNPYALCTPISPWTQRIPAGLRLQTAGRMNALGEEVIPVDVEAVLHQIEAVIEHIDALAICLLFAWKNPAHEQVLAQAIQQRFPQLELQCSYCFAELTTEYERCLRTVDSLQPEGWPSPHTATTHGQVPPRVVTDVVLALEDCANHMQAVLVDQAVSSIAKQAMDCAAAIFLPDGRLIAQAHSLPLLLGSLSPAVQGLLSVHPVASMQPGDGYVLNHPWMGGTHLPDLTLVRPVFQAGKLIALLACILHHQDVGGVVPGSLPSAATNVHQEGLLIPPVRLFAQEQMLSDMRQLLLANSRTPENFAGDLAAQWSALRAGEPQVQSLQAQWGAEFLSQCEAQIHQSSALARAAIAVLPDGLYHYRDALDGDGVVADPIAIDVKLRIQGEQLVIDLRDCADQSIGPANASRGAVQAAITYLARMIEPRCGS